MKVLRLESRGGPALSGALPCVGEIMIRKGCYRLLVLTKVHHIQWIVNGRLCFRFVQCLAYSLTKSVTNELGDRDGNVRDCTDYLIRKAPSKLASLLALSKRGCRHIFSSLSWVPSHVDLFYSVFRFFLFCLLEEKKKEIRGQKSWAENTRHSITANFLDVARLSVTPFSFSARRQVSTIDALVATNVPWLLIGVGQRKIAYLFNVLYSWLWKKKSTKLTVDPVTIRLTIIYNPLWILMKEATRLLSRLWKTKSYNDFIKKREKRRDGEK